MKTILEQMKEQLETEMAEFEELKTIHEKLEAIRKAKNELLRADVDAILEHLPKDENSQAMDNELELIESKIGTKATITDSVDQTGELPVHVSTVKSRNKLFQDVRVAKIDNVIYFVGYDVAKAVGFTNASDAVTKYVSNKIKRRVLLEDVTGRTRVMRFIDIDGVKELVLRSKSDIANGYGEWLSTIDNRIENGTEADFIAMKTELENLREQMALLGKIK